MKNKVKSERTYTLGIDYGASNVGIALVCNESTGKNVPLFAATLRLDARDLKEKVETRAGIRSLRRTKKTKKRRLRNLENTLTSIGLPDDKVASIIHFSKRRGYKSLFDEDISEETEEEHDSEFVYRFSREVFFQSLKSELETIVIDPSLRLKALSLCERILNKQGNPDHEIRRLRIDNRGASRCAWEDCNRVTPRSDNAIRDVLAQQIYNYFQTPLRENPSGTDTVEDVLHKLETISKRIRSASGDHVKEEKKALRKKARTAIIDLNRILMPNPFGVSDDKSWEYVEKAIMNTIEKRMGRNRYCREHSLKYIKTILAGKSIPFKKTITDADIISRREQIAYSKLWRYIEVRVLPLSPQGIDKIVVERTAFDLLAGSWKTIQGASDKFKEEMYQQGPMFGFSNRAEMLKEEFGGICAYCGKPSVKLMDREHILPRAKFFFDGYLNILPACPTCNSLKGKRAASDQSLAVAPEAYDAYKNYLAKKFKNRPMHFLHTVKKGILNLMKEPERIWDAEKYLSIVARQYAQIVQSQRSPRPFARLLCRKIKEIQGSEPRITFQSGRHTALYRNIAYPEFEKYADKEEGNTINHGLDAIILASNLPDFYPVESLNIPMEQLKGWTIAVRKRAPRPGSDGIPAISVKDAVEGFEKVHGPGYIEMEVRAMAWNKKNSMTHKQDPYGWSETLRMPTKRKAAADLYANMMKETSLTKLKSMVERFYHPALKHYILGKMSDDKPGQSAAMALKEWLRTSVKNSLPNSKFSNHPGDQARKADLENFVAAAAAPIPVIIGVKMIDTGVQGKIDLERMDPRTGQIVHRYMTQPPNKAVYVAYPKKSDGIMDPLKPCLLFLRQNDSIITESLAVFHPLPEGLARGHVLGGVKVIVHGRELLEKYLEECGFYCYIRLTPGCVINYKDGQQWFVRNFDQSKDFKKARLRNIKSVKKTPFSSRVETLVFLDK